MGLASADVRRLLQRQLMQVSTYVYPTDGVADLSPDYWFGAMTARPGRSDARIPDAVHGRAAGHGTVPRFQRRASFNCDSREPPAAMATTISTSGLGQLPGRYHHDGEDHGCRSTSRTMAFADAGRIDYWDDPANPVLQENYYCDPPSNQFPGVHFRHLGTANVGIPRRPCRQRDAGGQRRAAA